MGVLDTRVGDPERDRVVAVLARHYRAGRLSVAELEHRLERCERAVTRRDLLALTRDLPLDVPHLKRRARRAAARAGWYAHASAYGAGSGGLLTAGVISGAEWVLVPVAAWGGLLASHRWKAREAWNRRAARQRRAVPRATAR